MARCDHNGRLWVQAALLFIIGFGSGVAIKLLDIYTGNLGRMFSQMSIWVLICTGIAAFSSTPRRAAVKVPCYCFGMLAGYYPTAALTASVYAPIFFFGWSVFTLFTPLMAVLAWYARRGRHRLSILLAICILIAMTVVAVCLFDRVRVADIICMAMEWIVLNCIPTKKK